MSEGGVGMYPQPCKRRRWSKVLGDRIEEDATEMAVPTSRLMSLKSPPPDRSTTRMGQFVIEKGVPMLPKGRSGPQARYPYRDMDVGDSFFVPAANGDATKTQARLSGLVCSKSSWARRNGRKFTVRKVEGGVRVWRIA